MQVIFPCKFVDCRCIFYNRLTLFMEYPLVFCVFIALWFITMSKTFIFLCTNCLCDRWKECCSDSSHSVLRRERTGHKQRIVPQGFCEGRRKVNISTHHVMYNLYKCKLFLSCNLKQVRLVSFIIWPHVAPPASTLHCKKNCSEN